MQRFFNAAFQIQTMLHHCSEACGIQLPGNMFSCSDMGISLQHLPLCTHALKELSNRPMHNTRLPVLQLHVRPAGIGMLDCELGIVISPSSSSKAMSRDCLDLRVRAKLRIFHCTQGILDRYSSLTSVAIGDPALSSKSLTTRSRAQNRASGVGERQVERARPHQPTRSCSSDRLAGPVEFGILATPQHLRSFHPSIDPNDIRLDSPLNAEGSNAMVSSGLWLLESGHIPVNSPCPSNFSMDMLRK